MSKTVKFKLEDDEHAELRIECFISGTTVQDFVRELVMERLKKEHKKVMEKKPEKEVEKVVVNSAKESCKAVDEFIIKKSTEFKAVGRSACSKCFNNKPVMIIDGKWICEDCV